MINENRIGIASSVIDRVFRYIEMIGVTAVVGAAALVAYGETVSRALMFPMWLMIAFDIQIRIWPALLPGGFPIQHRSPAFTLAHSAAVLVAAAILGSLVGIVLQAAVNMLVDAALSIK